MTLELLTFNGYGQFVWPAFIFTFLCCLTLYLKAKREFIKEQKIYLEEFKEYEYINIVAKKRKKVLLASSV
jgi:heme exporter protein D